MIQFFLGYFNYWYENFASLNDNTNLPVSRHSMCVGVDCYMVKVGSYYLLSY